MNEWFDANAPVWRLAGWTMLHFLWVGTLVAALGAAMRLACRRAAPGVRYGASLAMLAAVAVAPVMIAAVLARDSDIWEKLASRRDAATVGESLRDAHPATIDNGAMHDQGADLPSTAESILAAELASRKDAATVGESLRDSHSPDERGLAAIVAWLPALWLIGAPLTFAWLAAGLVGSRRLRGGATELDGGPAFDACLRLSRSLGVVQRVAVATCERVVQPVLVGIVRPVILLPAAALSGWSPEELEMVLVHELAHVRRWDNLVNLGQRIVESLLFFHPCVWLASRQVRRDREECCDALVVRHMQRPEAYASLLVSIAAAVRSEPGRPRPRRLADAAALAAASTLGGHPLKARVRRILKLEDETMRVTRGTVGAAAALVLAMLATAVLLPISGASQADEAVAEVTEGVEIVALRKVYAKSQLQEIDFLTWNELIAKDRDDVHVSVDPLDPDDVDVIAPPRVHERIAELLEKAGATRVWEGLRGRADKDKKRRPDIIDPSSVEGQHRLKRIAAEIDRLREPGEVAAAVLPFPVSPDAVSRRVKELNTLGHNVRIAVGSDFNVLFAMDLEATNPQLFETITREELSAELIRARQKLQKKLEDLKARQKATGIGNVEFELTKLRGDITMYQQQIVKIEEQLVELEAKKQTALEHAQSPEALRATVKAEIDNDPTASLYKEQIAQLSAQSKALISKNGANGQEFKQLIARIDQIDHERRSHLIDLEYAVKERLAKLPNEALRAAIVEYNVKAQYLNKQKQDIVAKLKAVELKLKKLSVVDPETEMLEQEIESQQRLVQHLEEKIREWQHRALDEQESSRPGWEQPGGGASMTIENGQTWVAFPAGVPPEVAKKSLDELEAAGWELEDVEGRWRLKGRKAGDAESDKAVDRVKHSRKSAKPGDEPRLFAYAKLLGEAPELGVTWSKEFGPDGENVTLHAPQPVQDALAVVERCFDDYEKATAAGKEYKLVGRDEEFHRLFRPSDDNPLVTMKHSVEAFDKLVEHPNAFHDVLMGLVKDPYGPKLPIEAKPIDDGRRLVVTAAQGGQTLLRLALTEDSPVFAAFKQGRLSDRPAEAAEEEWESSNRDKAVDSATLGSSPESDEPQRPWVWRAGDWPADVTREDKERIARELAESGARVQASQMPDQSRFSFAVQLDPEKGDNPRIVWEERLVDGKPQKSARVVFEHRDGDSEAAADARDAAEEEGDSSDDVAAAAAGMDRSNWRSLRIEVPRDQSMAELAALVEDLEAAGNEVQISKMNDRWQLEIRTPLANPKPVWETRIVDGQPRKVMRLVDTPAPYVAASGDPTPAEEPATRDDKRRVLIVQPAQARDSVVTTYLEIKSPMEARSAAWHPLVKSLHVLEAALARPGIRDLALIKAHAGEELLWLVGELKVNFSKDSPILDLRFECDGPATQDHVKVLDAVAAAFVDAVEATALPATRGDEAGVGNPSPRPSRGGRGAYHRLAPGDMVLVRSLGALPDQPLDGQFEVEEFGTLALGPAYGRVEVEGLTVLEAEAAVTKALAEVLSNPKVQVTLMSRASAEEQDNPFAAPAGERSR